MHIFAFDLRIVNFSVIFLYSTLMSKKHSQYRKWKNYLSDNDIINFPPNELLTFNSVTSLSFVLTAHSNIVFHTKENEGIQLIGLHEFRISIFLIYGFLRIRQTFCRKIYNNGLDRLYREISLTFLISEV